MTKKKLKYTYFLRISIAIRCDVSKKTFFSMITLTVQYTLYMHRAREKAFSLALC